jgi:glucan phosphorylase
MRLMPLLTDGLIVTGYVLATATWLYGAYHLLRSRFENVTNGVTPHRRKAYRSAALFSILCVFTGACWFLAGGWQHLSGGR